MNILETIERNTAMMRWTCSSNDKRKNTKAISNLGNRRREEEEGT
jgi:hypothetical protein